MEARVPAESGAVTDLQTEHGWTGGVNTLQHANSAPNQHRVASLLHEFLGREACPGEVDVFTVRLLAHIIGNFGPAKTLERSNEKIGAIKNDDDIGALSRAPNARGLGDRGSMSAASRRMQDA